MGVLAACALLRRGGAWRQAAAEAGAVRLLWRSMLRDGSAAAGGCLAGLVRVLGPGFVADRVPSWADDLQRLLAPPPPAPAGEDPGEGAAPPPAGGEAEAEAGVAPLEAQVALELGCTVVGAFARAGAAWRGEVVHRAGLMRALGAAAGLGDGKGGPGGAEEAGGGGEQAAAEGHGDDGDGPPAPEASPAALRTLALLACPPSPLAKSLLDLGIVLLLKRILVKGGGEGQGEEVQGAAAQLLATLAAQSSACAKLTSEFGGLDILRALLPRPEWEPPADDKEQDTIYEDQEVELDETFLADILRSEEQKRAQAKREEEERQKAAELLAAQEAERKKNAVPLPEKPASDPAFIAQILKVIQALCVHESLEDTTPSEHEKEVEPPWHFVLLQFLEPRKAELEAPGAPPEENEEGEEEGSAEEEKEEAPEEPDAEGEAAGATVEEAPPLEWDDGVQVAALEALLPMLDDPEVVTDFVSSPALGHLMEKLAGKPNVELQKAVLATLPPIIDVSADRADVVAQIVRGLKGAGARLVTDVKFLRTPCAWSILSLPEESFHPTHRPPPEDSPPPPPPPPLATSRFIWDALGRPEVIDGMDLARKSIELASPPPAAEPVEG